MQSCEEWRAAGVTWAREKSSVAPRSDDFPKPGDVRAAGVTRSAFRMLLHHHPRIMYWVPEFGSGSQSLEHPQWVPVFGTTCGA